MSTRPVTSLRLGYSPCPNDTFIFYALAHGLIDDGVAPQLHFDVHLDDVEALNRAADRAELDVAKVSYHAYGYLTDRYVMLRAGGALGSGVGPLIVTREAVSSLAGRRIAIPGGRTTANLLLKLSQPEAELVEMRYDTIMPAVAHGDVDAGLIIHESRFTYPEHGLRCFLDLGAWWEQITGELVPLGGIVARRELGPVVLHRLQAMLRASLAYAWENPTATRPYVAGHAQEMDAGVRQRHIELYVNRYSMDVGVEGERATRALFERAVEQGLFPTPERELFLEGEDPDRHGGRLPPS